MVGRFKNSYRWCGGRRRRRPLLFTRLPHFPPHIFRFNKSIGESVNLLKLMPLTALCVLSPISVALASASANQNESGESSAAEHMLVSASRFASSEQASAMSMTVISSDEIARMGARNIADVLSAQPGLQVSDAIGNMGRGVTVSMRGFGDNAANNVLILLNGRKLNNPSLASPDLASILLINVKRIEILNGSAGTLYGDQATAGVINIITFENTSDGLVEASRGSDDLEAYRASANLVSIDKISLRLSGEKKLADNYRDNNEQSYENAMAYLGLNLENFSAYVDAQNVDDKLRLPGSLNSEQVAQNRRQSVNVNDYSDRTTDAYRAGIHWQMTEQWRLLVDGSDREEETAGYLYGNFNTSTQMKTLQPRISGSLNSSIGRFQLVGGFDSEHAEHGADYGYGASFLEQSIEDYYAQLQWFITKPWTLSVGARNSQFELDDSSNALIAQDISVAQLSAAYQISDSTKTFLRADESFRWPNADENSFVGPTQAFLLPQQSVSYEWGFESSWSMVDYSVLVYRMTLENEIFFDPFADGPWGPGTGANVNLDESERTGLTLASTLRLSNDSWLKLSYTFTDAQLSSGTFAGNDVPWVAQHLANARYSFKLWEQWSAYADWQYTGERYAIGDNSNSGKMLGGYSVFNLSLRWDAAHWYSIVRINNVGDKAFNGYSGGISPYDYHYPAALQRIEVSAGYTF